VERTASALQTAPVEGRDGAEAVAKEEPDRRYVDGARGFEISRPSTAWQLETSQEPLPTGINVPVVLRHPDTGAQVVLQLVPPGITSVQFAEKLNSGLRSHPGVTTSEPEPEPEPMAEGAIGFHFSMGRRLLGRVVVVEGRSGQIFMMMATWPSNAQAAVNAGVEAILGSLKSFPPT